MHRDPYGRWKPGKSHYKKPKLMRLEYKRDGGFMDQFIGKIPSSDGKFVVEDDGSVANSMTPRSALSSARSASTIMSASTDVSDSDSSAAGRALMKSAAGNRRTNIKRRWVRACPAIVNHLAHTFNTRVVSHLARTFNTRACMSCHRWLKRCQNDLYENVATICLYWNATMICIGPREGLVKLSAILHTLSHTRV